jgi:capsular polysaccharide biosynthesis protein
MIAEGSAENISMATRPYEHEAGYRDLLQLARAPLVRNARIERLTVYVDYAQNSYKAARYRTLRARLRARVGVQASAPRGVYIGRGATGEPRVLENEAAITRLLAGEGFDVIDPAAASVEEIAKRSLGARIVVGVEGSHLSHAIYSAADDCAFLVLQPPDRFAMAYKEFTDRLDMTFAFLVGDRSQHGFVIPPDDLRRMLDVLETRRAAASRHE